MDNIAGKVDNMAGKLVTIYEGSRKRKREERSERRLIFKGKLKGVCEGLPRGILVNSP